MPRGNSTASESIDFLGNGGQGYVAPGYGGASNRTRVANGGSLCVAFPATCEASPRAAVPARIPAERATTFAAELERQSNQPRPVAPNGVEIGLGNEPQSPRPVWSDAEVVLTIDPSYAALPFAMQALKGALLAWTTRCDRLPKVTLRHAESTTPTQSLEENLGDHRIVYAPRGDARAKGALAVTLVTADEGANAIVDADILVNGAHRFTDVSVVRATASDQLYDLQNVLTHEFGHWFGLDEEYENTESTMYAFVYPGESKKRDLTDEDVNAILLAQAQADEANANAVGCSMVQNERQASGGWLGYVLALSLFRMAFRRKNQR